MLFKEQARDLIELDYERFAKAPLAVQFTSAVEPLGRWMLRKDPDENRPQGYRLASWVEHPSYMTGYAFGLSRPVSESLGNFTLRGMLAVVDRSEEKVLGYPKEIAFNSASGIEENAEQVLDVFTKDEIICMIGMTRKMIKCAHARQPDTGIDRHVARALIDEHLDTLGEMFPRPIDSTQLSAA